MRNCITFIIVLAVTACGTKPYSQDYIYTKKDDRLDLQGKVALLGASETIKDDALLSAISLLYAQNKNWVKAKESISNAIKLSPVNSTYHVYLANYNAELTNNKEAYEEAKVAFELGTYDKNLEALLAKMALETADTLNSNKFVTAYYQANKNKLEAKILMARLYLLEQSYYEANSLAQKIIKQDSINLDAIKVAYISNSNMDSVRLAIYYGEKLLEVDSTNAQYYFELGRIYLRQGKTAKAAYYFANSYEQQPLVSSLYLALDNYNRLANNDSVIYYSDSLFAGINSKDKHILLRRARAFDRTYKYEEALAVYSGLIKMDSTDSVVNAEQAFVQRKISYLWRKKRQQQQLADSLANSMPRINF